MPLRVTEEAMIQGVLFREGPKLMIINHAVSYRPVRESVNTRLSRLGDAWVSEEEAEIGFTTPEVTGVKVSGQTGPC
jgi:hypothetical protein